MGYRYGNVPGRLSRLFLDTWHPPVRFAQSGSGVFVFCPRRGPALRPYVDVHGVARRQDLGARRGVTAARSAAVLPLSCGGHVEVGRGIGSGGVIRSRAGPAPDRHHGVGATPRPWGVGAIPRLHGYTPRGDVVAEVVGGRRRLLGCGHSGIASLHRSPAKGSRIVAGLLTSGGANTGRRTGRREL